MIIVKCDICDCDMLLNEVTEKPWGHVDFEHWDLAKELRIKEVCGACREKQQILVEATWEDYNEARKATWEESLLNLIEDQGQ